MSLVSLWLVIEEESLLKLSVTLSSFPWVVSLWWVRALLTQGQRTCPDSLVKTIYLPQVPIYQPRTEGWMNTWWVREPSISAATRKSLLSYGLECKALY